MTSAGEPAFVAQTLAWCNDRRAEKGQEPLGRLPKGKRHNSASCPCGRAAGAVVGLYEWSNALGLEWGNAEGDARPLPDAVQQFVKAFDSGRLPQYDEKVAFDSGRLPQYDEKVAS